MNNKKDIRIFNYEGELLHIEPFFISSNWTVHYNDVGSFELHFDANSDLTKILIDSTRDKTDINLIAVQGDLQADITGYQLLETKAVIYGSSLNNLLHRRVIPSFKDIKGAVDVIVKSFIDDYYNFLIFGAGKTFENEIAFWRNTYNDGFEVIRDCLNRENAGHIVRFDRQTKSFTFEILKGERIPLVLSKGNRNIYDLESSVFTDKYNNSGWYEHEYKETSEWGTEADDSPDLTTGDHFGEKYRVIGGGTLNGATFRPEDHIACHEHNNNFIVVPADDLGFWQYIDSPETGIYKKEFVIHGANEVEAAELLSKAILEEELITKTKNLTCGVDYNLGDIVRIQHHGITIERRIIGIDYWWEDLSSGEQPILGEVNIIIEEVKSE